MNSFTGWIGGKKLLRKSIIEMFPTDEIKRYIEVFGGAGWVLFGKEYNSKQLEVFNDLNNNLINLYRCIKYHCEELIKEINTYPSSRELFFDFKCQLQNRGLTDIQRAARYYYILKTSFGNDRRSFATDKVPLNKGIEYLSQIQSRLSNVVIENKDFENLIKVYDRDKALFYLDPPYHGTEKYYDNNFSKEDHLRLKNVLHTIKGNFILSYNDDEFIRQLYKDYNIKSIKRSNNLSQLKNKSQFSELIITNY